MIMLERYRQDCFVKNYLPIFIQRIYVLVLKIYAISCTTNSHSPWEEALNDYSRRVPICSIKTIGQYQKGKGSGSRDYWIMMIRPSGQVYSTALSLSLSLSFLEILFVLAEALLNSLPWTNVLATLPMTIMTIITVTTLTIIIRFRTPRHRVNTALLETSSTNSRLASSSSFSAFNRIRDQSIFFAIVPISHCVKLEIRRNSSGGNTSE